MPGSIDTGTIDDRETQCRRNLRLIFEMRGNVQLNYIKKKGSSPNAKKIKDPAKWVVQWSIFSNQQPQQNAI